MHGFPGRHGDIQGTASQAAPFVIAHGVIGKKFKILQMPDTLKKGGGFPHVLRIVVESGNDGGADDRRDPLAVDPEKILNDPVIGLTGGLPVLFRIHVLDIRHDQIQIRQQGSDGLPGKTQVAFDGGGNVFLPAGGQQLPGKFGLHEDLSPGERHASAGAGDRKSVV